MSCEKAGCCSFCLLQSSSSLRAMTSRQQPRWARTERPNVLLAISLDSSTWSWFGTRDQVQHSYRRLTRQRTNGSSLDMSRRVRKSFLKAAVSTQTNRGGGRGGSSLCLSYVLVHGRSNTGSSFYGGGTGTTCPRATVLLAAMGRFGNPRYPALWTVYQRVHRGEKKEASTRRMGSGPRAGRNMPYPGRRFWASHPAFRVTWTTEARENGVVGRCPQRPIVLG